MPVISDLLRRHLILVRPLRAGTVTPRAPPWSAEPVALAVHALVLVVLALRLFVIVHAALADLVITERVLVARTGDVECSGLVVPLPLARVQWSVTARRVVFAITHANHAQSRRAAEPPIRMAHMSISR